jgi:hypothetical protein
VGFDAGAIRVASSPLILVAASDELSGFPHDGQKLALPTIGV